MNCETWQDKIDPFVDGELSAELENGFRDHLRQCPGCGAETVARQQLKAQTALAGRRFVASPALQKKIEAQLGPQRRPAWRWVAALGAAAVVVIAVAIAALNARSDLIEQQSLVQLVDEHLAAETSPTWIADQTSDPEALKSWLNTKVPFSVDAPSIKDTPFRLVGGTVAFIQRNSAAHLVFAAHHHQFSVFIFPDSPATSGFGNRDVAIRRMGYETESWTEDGLRYFAISEGSAEDVKGLCDLLKKANQG